MKKRSEHGYRWYDKPMLKIFGDFYGDYLFDSGWYEFQNTKPPSFFTWCLGYLKWRASRAVCYFKGHKIVEEVISPEDGIYEHYCDRCGESWRNSFG